MEAAVELRGVTKTFGKTIAVGDLDLSVPQGGLYGFIGPNGAGKTTTIRLLMSILFPDSGAISVLGCASALEAKKRIGYLPEERGVYRKMHVGAFLEYIANLKGYKGADLNKRIKASLERVDLGRTLKMRCEELSKGMLQKVQFIAAIIHQPDLLILDEPFSGLDPVSSRGLRDLVLEEHRRGATILFSTHVMPQAEDICQSIVMIHQGRKVLDDNLANLRSQYDPRNIEFEPLDRSADTTSIAKLHGIERVESNGTGCRIHLSEGTDTALAMHRIIDTVKPARLELSRPRLEDIFIRLVSTESDTAEQRLRLRADLESVNAQEAGL